MHIAAELERPLEFGTNRRYAPRRTLTLASVLQDSGASAVRLTDRGTLIEHLKKGELAYQFSGGDLTVEPKRLSDKDTLGLSLQRTF